MGGWLTHGDMVLDTNVDFLVVVEHRLVPARVRGEWASVLEVLLLSGLLLLKNPPMLVMVVLGSLVCGVLRFRCLPLLLLNSGVFLIVAEALRCLLPVASGRFLHLVVLYGYQGADGDAERLSLTDQLFDAALGELEGCCY